jgi:hypothetical protein|tara:strand:+ start:687 stop:839 length:153 start_codon:yes stop_codon:yes gene_type:complete
MGVTMETKDDKFWQTYIEYCSMMNNDAKSITNEIGSETGIEGEEDYVNKN